MALSPQEATQSCLIYFTLGPKYLCYKTTKIAVAKRHQPPNFQNTIWLDKSWKRSWWGSHICLVRQSTQCCVLVGFQHWWYHDGNQSICALILTVSGESQLSASHVSIISIPEVITHSTPLVVHADLNPTLGGIGSKACQSDCTCRTASCIQT